MSSFAESLSREDELAWIIADLRDCFGVSEETALRIVTEFRAHQAAEASK
ncbi:hypothetical protein ACFPA8_12360 [Streptomyces ovatisporus]|uniref:Uncharacterized protein n=1 Tax=Streptomyces ovatisporus TaxID=1128682 RepID=A0ABV9A8N5_9ACTN